LFPVKQIKLDAMHMETQNKLTKIEVTIQEIWAATRPIIQKSRKEYSRKEKHKKKFGY
jgi:hypothetical protein